MTLLYIDTNIFINAIRDENNRKGEDMSMPAIKMFADAASCKYHLLVSDWAMEELFKIVSKEESLMIFKVIEKKVIRVGYNDCDVAAAKQKSHIHFEDALHIIIAEKSKSDAIITRNDKDFIKIGTYLPVKKPEQL